MIKKHVLGGALFLTSLFILSSCGEMSSWDNPVSSYLQASEDAPIVGIGETYSITKGKDYSTISTANPEFFIAEESEGIAEVDQTSGVVTGLKSGDAKIVISLPKDEDGLYLAAVDTFTVKVRVKNTVQFVKAVENIDATAEENNILLAAAADIDLTSVDAISINFDGNVAIKGEESKPATIKAIPFIMKKKIAIENVNIEATGLGTSNLLTYSSEPDESLNTSTTTTARYNIYGDAIVLKNVNVDNIPRGLIYDNDMCYVPENVIISNCVLHFVPTTGNMNAINFNKDNNGIKNLTIEKTTAYATGSGKLGYFVKYSNNARIDRLGYDSSKDKIEFHYNNNTFYGLCSNYFHNYSNNLKNFAIFDITKNIFYYNNTNSTQTKQIVQRIVGQASKAAGTELNFDGNAFLHNGTPYDCNQSDDNKQSYNVDTNSVSYDPGFTDPDNGNFKPTEAHFNSEDAPGDPRWRK